MKKTFFISLFLLLTFFANAKEVDFYNSMFYKADINAKEAYKMHQEGALLIDIRTKKEFNDLRAKDSINIPLFYEQNNQRVFNKNFLNQIYEQTNKDVNKKIILICRSGSRTKLGSNLLAYNGFTNVYNVKKGFAYDWKPNNFPTEK